MPAEPTDPLPPKRANTRGLGLGSVVFGSLVAVVLSGFVIWLNDLSWVWAVLLYPVIGMALTFLFSALVVLRARKQNPPAAAATPQSAPKSLRSREQTPPR